MDSAQQSRRRDIRDLFGARASAEYLARHAQSLTGPGAILPKREVCYYTSSAGLAAVLSFVFPLKSALSNNQTFIVGGITYEYEVVSSGFEATGGDVVVIDITGTSTAASVATAVAAAVNLEAGSTVTAATPSTATVTFTGKTAGAMSAPSGTGAGTGAIVTAGYTTDALTLADGKRIGQRVKIVHVVAGSSGTLTAGAALHLAYVPTSATGIASINLPTVNYWIDLLWSGKAWVPVRNGGATITAVT